MEKTINSKQLKELFVKSGDIVQRPLNIGHKGITVHLFGVDGLMSTLMLDETILKPLTLDENLKDMQTEKEVMEYLLEGGAFHAFTDEVADYQLLLRYILSGMAALVFDQEQKALIFDVRDFDKRSITEPSDEGGKGFLYRGYENQYRSDSQTAKVRVSGYGTAQCRKTVQNGYYHSIP